MNLSLFPPPQAKAMRLSEKPVSPLKQAGKSAFSALFCLFDSLMLERQATARKQTPMKNQHNGCFRRLSALFG